MLSKDGSDESLSFISLSTVQYEELGNKKQNSSRLSVCVTNEWWKLDREKKMNFDGFDTLFW